MKRHGRRFSFQMACGGVGWASGWSEAYRPDARLPVLSLRRAIPEAIFRFLELNDHTFFNQKLKRGPSPQDSRSQPIEIPVLSCDKHTDVRFFKCSFPSLE